MTDKENTSPSANIKEEIDGLTERLSYYSRKYYVEDDPVITDSEYDSLFRMLEELENSNQGRIQTAGFSDAQSGRRTSRAL